MAADWLTLAEILPHAGAELPATMSGLADHVARDGWRTDPRRCQMRWGRGGGHEYHFTLLPAAVQARLGLASAPAAAIPEAEGRSSALWAAFERLSPGAKAKAQDRLAAVDAVEALMTLPRNDAVVHVAAQRGIGASTLWSWLSLVEGAARRDRLAILAPRTAGRTATAECDPRAWDFFVADYLRPAQPALEACYGRLIDAAQAHGWAPIPSSRTLQRRIEREFPKAVLTLAREGRDAAARTFPAQRRDRSIFHACQAMNADGHKVDVTVEWEDGTKGRPIITVFQDLLSGTLLSSRVDKTENREVVRLAFADVVEQWGVPEHLFLDNGRHFASKWLSAGASHRYRFKRRDEEPEGIFKAVGVQEIHWTTPYHGQSKPIERAFLDLCQQVAKNPTFAGAYTGRSPMHKPSDYGTRAIPIADFKQVLAREIDRHNAKTGRRGGVCAGRSFLQVIADSLSAGALVTRATAAQRRMLLLAAEGVTARKPTGEIHVLGNRYWSEELLDHMGERLIARFDPEDLTRPVAVYSFDNRFVCEADALGDVAFIDAAAARAWGQAKRDYLRSTREQLDAERRLTLDHVVRLMPGGPAPARPQPKAVRLVAGGRAQPDWDDEEDFGRGVEAMAAGRLIPFVPRKEEGDA